MKSADALIDHMIPPHFLVRRWRFPVKERFLDQFGLVFVSYSISISLERIL